MLAGAKTPLSVATACLAGAVFVPAIPAGAVARGSAPASPARPATSDGTLSVCQAMTNSLDTSSAWNFTVRPKGSKKVVASGLVPNGTKNYPACRTISLPPGSYTVAETQKKKQPVVSVVVKNQNGSTKTYKARKGKALTSAPFGIVEYGVTTVTFFNKIG